MIIPELTYEETSILENVFEVFGKYSAWELRNMTHEENPWKDTKQGNVIDLSLINEYFRAHYIEV